MVLRYLFQQSLGVLIVPAFTAGKLGFRGD